MLLGSHVGFLCPANGPGMTDSSEYDLTSNNEPKAWRLVLGEKKSLLALGTSSELVELADLWIPYWSLFSCCTGKQSAFPPLAQCHLQPSHFRLRLFVCPEPPRTCDRKAYNPTRVDSRRWGRRQNGVAIQLLPCILAVAQEGRCLGDLREGEGGIRKIRF